MLKPGGTIIEPTSGNTGHGLAIAAALKGYRCIFVMADKQSTEKQALLRAYGAEVVLCPTNVAPESPESYYSVAARLARDIPGAFKPDQYWNMENPTAHERTTGPEIWDQTEGRITHFVASVGTGGTISGAAHYLRGKKPDDRDRRRRSRRAASCPATPPGPTSRRAIGEDFFPGTYDPAVVDRWVRVSRPRRVRVARRLTREEGILAGESCGTALVAALDEVARELTEEPARPPSKVIVVILPDGGRSYLSKLYNDEWMRVNGLLATTGAVVRVAELLADRHHDVERPPVVLARTTERVGEAIETAPGVRDQPDAGVRGRRRRCRRRDRRLDQREGPAGPGVPRPVDRRADRRRGDGRAAAAGGRLGDPRRGVRAAVVAARRRSSRSAARRPAGVVTKLDLLEYLRPPAAAARLSAR